MSKKRKTDDWRTCWVAWAALLERARRDGNEGLAAAVKCELRRLGVKITFAKGVRHDA